MSELGRKFALVLLMVAIFGILTGLDKMTIDAYSDFCLWILGLYFGANVGQKFVPAMRKQV